MNKLTIHFLLASLVISGCTSRGPDTSPTGGALEQGSGIKPNPGELIRAVAAGNHLKTRSLLDRGADVNEVIQTSDGPITPLLVAAVNRDRDLIEALLKKKAKTHSRFGGYTARDFLYFLQAEDSAQLIDEE